MGLAKIRVDVRPLQVTRGTLVYVDIESNKPDLASCIAKRPDEIAIIFDRESIEQLIKSSELKESFWRWLQLDVYSALEGR